MTRRGEGQKRGPAGSEKRERRDQNPAAPPRGVQCPWDLPARPRSGTGVPRTAESPVPPCGEGAHGGHQRGSADATAQPRTRAGSPVRLPREKQGRRPGGRGVPVGRAARVATAWGMHSRKGGRGGPLEGRGAPEFSEPGASCARISVPTLSTHPSVSHEVPLLS